jgi:hypothetical protein
MNARACGPTTEFKRTRRREAKLRKEGPRRRREKSGIAEQIPGLNHGQRVVERRELGNDGACD